MAMRQPGQTTSSTMEVSATPDRVIDWLDELDALLAKAVTLPPAARTALVATLDAFEAEDGGLPPAAERARRLLLGPPRTHRTPTAVAAAAAAGLTAAPLTRRQAALPV